MMERFPDDPFPCLELANLYYETRAFRKAENVLKQAMQRAPHDNRVIELHILSLLISVEKNLKPEKLHLAEKDLKKIESLENKKFLPFIISKQIIFEIFKDEEKDFNELLSNKIKSLSLYEQLKTLAILILDFTPRFGRQHSYLKDAEKILNEKIKT